MITMEVFQLEPLRVNSDYYDIAQVSPALHRPGMLATA